MKDIILDKKESRELINLKLKDKSFELIDEYFMSNNTNHNWKCKCGNIFQRKWHNMKRTKDSKCRECMNQEIENRYRYYVEKEGYKYIRSYRKHDVLPNGKVVGDKPYIEVKCGYCENQYAIESSGFIKANKRCGYCCKTYENSFEYHVENVLNKKIEDVWDYEKNVVNPKHIVKYFTRYKVWIKCDVCDYHGSNQMTLQNYSKGQSCPYCSSKKIHPYDSFGYHNFDKVMNWHPDNGISPFRVAKNSNKKYKFICYECNSIVLKTPNEINRYNKLCGVCEATRGEKRIISWLRINRINYIYNTAYFDDLLSDKGNPLRPDFILPKHKIWIEYDGEFHYMDFHKDGSFEIGLINDKRKDEYAKKHGWKMIRIPYWEFDNIENILNSEINYGC